MKELQHFFEKKGDTLYLLKDHDAIKFLNGSIESNFITSLHLISDKGLFDSLVESCSKNLLGFDITGDSELDEKEFLYGKIPYKAIVSVDGEQEDDFVDFMFNHHIELTLLGHVTKGELRMDDKSYGFIKEIVK